MQQGHSFESTAFLMRSAPKKGSLSLLNESLSEQKSSCLLSREGSSLNTCTAATWRAVYYSAKCYRWCYSTVIISLGKQCNFKKITEKKVCLLVYQFYMLVLITRVACSKKKDLFLPSVKWVIWQVPQVCRYLQNNCACLIKMCMLMIFFLEIQSLTWC